MNSSKTLHFHSSKMIILKFFPFFMHFSTHKFIFSSRLLDCTNEKWHPYFYKKCLTKKKFFLPMWRAKDFSLSFTTNFHAFSVDFFAWKKSRKDPRKLLTISHSVLTWVSVSCLHSFSCSIHWSKSFKVVLSSMIIFTRNFCRLYRIFNHLFHTKRTQETIGSVYWLFFKNCFLAKRIKYLTKKLVIRKTDNCNPNKFKMANRLGMTRWSAGEVCVQWVWVVWICFGAGVMWGFEKMTVKNWAKMSIELTIW